MTHVVTKHDFGKNVSKYMKIAKTETVIIIKTKQSGWDDGWVLISWDEYNSLLEKANGKVFK